jgi:tetratricopeptide (TPR) repeat protein
LGAAYATLQRAIELAPDSGRAYYNLGMVYIKSGKIDQALENFLMANKYQGDPNSFIDAGYVYLLQGKFQEARNMFNKSIENNQITFLAQYYLGLTEKMSGHSREAMNQFKLVLDYLDKQELPEGYGDHLLAIKAKTLASLGEKDKAMDILRQFAVENVSSGEILYFLARAYALVGDLGNCKAFLDKAVNEPGGPTTKEAALDPHFTAEPD